MRPETGDLVGRHETLRHLEIEAMKWPARKAAQVSMSRCLARPQCLAVSMSPQVSGLRSLVLPLRLCKPTPPPAPLAPGGGRGATALPHLHTCTLAHFSVKVWKCENVKMWKCPLHRDRARIPPPAPRSPGGGRGATALPVGRAPRARRRPMWQGRTRPCSFRFARKHFPKP